VYAFEDNIDPVILSIHILQIILLIKVEVPNWWIGGSKEKLGSDSSVNLRLSPYWKNSYLIFHDYDSFNVPMMLNWVECMESRDYCDAYSRKWGELRRKWWWNVSLFALITIIFICILCQPNKGSTLFLPYFL